MDDLKHVIYVSKEATPFTQEEIHDLLALSRDKNKEHGITGMLLYTEGTFFQVIEGAEVDVNNLYSNISKDERHTNIVEIVNEAISKRYFSNWSMGYATAPLHEIAMIEGLNSFFVDKTCLSQIDRGRAVKILNAFASGRWRLS